MIIDVVVYYPKVLKSIITDWDSIFASKFWSSLWYFLENQKKLFLAFHSQTYGQTKRQNKMMKMYIRAFINWEQNEKTRLQSIAEFAYNNTKNTSTGRTLFKLNCGFHLKILFKENIDPRFQFCLAKKLANKLRKLIKICCQNLLHA